MRKGASPLLPESKLIRDKREAMFPKVSMREAARRAGIPEATWRQAENGAHRPRREHLARMALAVEASPAELEQAGRPDAARSLEALMLRRAEDAEVPEELLSAAAGDAGLSGLLAEIVHGLQDIDASRMLTRSQKADLKEELIAELTRNVRERRQNVRAVLRITGGRAVS